MADNKMKEALGGNEDEKAALNSENTNADGQLMLEDGDLDNSRARFISNNHEKGDADGSTTPAVYVDVEGKTKIEENFVGLTKEELMKFADDPYWKRVRMILLVLFWFGWCAMLGASILIICLAPKCPPRPKLDWWQKSAVYEVAPKSFMDSNGDGIGDLNGIHQKLSYLQGHPDSLNISALWLHSIYPHGGTSNGYDVTDFMSISEEFGTLEDFTNLKIAMHKQGLKLIMDFIPNHTSKKHPWFEKSVAKESGYTDYYVWHDGVTNNHIRDPPNNWESLDGGSAWTLDTTRNQFYLHHYSADQPDLNLRNTAVKQELENALLFWMEQDVDGFRVHGAPYLYEDPDFKNDEADKIVSRYNPESYLVITEWRELLEAYGKKVDRVKFLMVESYGTPNQTSLFTEYNMRPGAHLVTNPELFNLKSGCEADCVHELVKTWVSVAAPRDIWSNWQTGGTEQARLLDRFDGNREMINVVNMLLLTLPGTSFTYYGEEIGMSDLSEGGPTQGDLRHQSPMQWDASPMGGFTMGNSTWLPFGSEYQSVNVKKQLAHGVGVSNLEVFSELMKLREEPSIQWGDLEIGVLGNVLFYIRQAERFPGFLVAINFGPSESNIDFVHNAPEESIVPATAKVVATTHNLPESAKADYTIGSEADLSNLVLADKAGVVFRWEADAIKS